MGHDGPSDEGTQNTTACRSQPFSISYDDAARTIVLAFEPGGIGTCPMLTSMSSYDAMGLLSRTSTTITIAGPFGTITTTSVGTNVVGVTAQACK